MGGVEFCGLCARMVIKNCFVVCFFGGPTFEFRPITQSFPHHHWENFPTKMKRHTALIDHVYTVYAMNSHTHHAFKHTPHTHHTLTR